MPSPQQLRERLQKKLMELFQLDQPDLDFGFYRIMHVKAQEIKHFIEKDLLAIVEQAFGQVDQTRSAELQTAYEKALQTARDYGAPNPEETEPVRKAKAAIDALKETVAGEADVYDHLYRFFTRYYDDGDFISRRYYTRETPGKAAPFAIPYNGEEVKLYWANADQYYIKTTEYFSTFTFDLIQSTEIRAMTSAERILCGVPEKPMRVLFRVVDATEGEHGNVKPAETGKRFFVIHDAKPVEFTADGELTINFEYRPDQERSGQEKTWRDKRNAETVNTVLQYGATILDMTDEALNAQLGGRLTPDRATITEYFNLLNLPAPTESDKKRPLLAKYVNQYTARNTKDYFIHKDLGGFLSRELDFYIKNEVMRLDDIENADAPAVESYLSKLKVLRKIAAKLIDFLAQLENFQKKLWLKKKFVVETNYCITLDRVPESLYPLIATNEAQTDEWIRLFAIDEIQVDLLTPRYSRPLTPEFLKAHNRLVLDTRFFDDEFTAKLVASINDFDEHCDGLLIHSENFQAISFLRESYSNNLQSIYIDPPYNTDASAIMYKNDYKDSSWLSLMANRLLLSSRLLKEDGIICVAIDDEEVHSLHFLLSMTFPKQIGIVAVRSNPAGRKTKGKFAPAHEYVMFFGNSENAIPSSLTKSEKSLSRYPKQDEKGRFAWANFIRSGNNDKREDRPKLFYPIFVDNQNRIRIPRLKWADTSNEYVLLEQPNDEEVIVYPIVVKGGCAIEKNWQRGHRRVPNEIEDYRVRRDHSGHISIDFKTRMDEVSLPITWWDDAKYASANYGALELKELFGEKEFDFPKARLLVIDCLRASGVKQENSIVLDYFAGSGTAAAAVIYLNREDNGHRKYILVEMGDHFDTVLKPRIAKVVYSAGWKDGKPTERDTGISHCFKYIRLESYEDTLNNLRFDENPARTSALAGNPSLREDYLLHYLLEVETRGSQSLLNIDAFADPTAYRLNLKRPGSNEYVSRPVDLLETFNYLIGLRVAHIDVPQAFDAAFQRIPDPELPEDQHTKLLVDGEIHENAEGSWWFRKVEGWAPKNLTAPTNGQRERILIVWRKLTGDQEKDNLMLDEWFLKNRSAAADTQFDAVYVNGSNNLQNLKPDGETWEVRLIEEEFHKRMWDIVEF